MSLTLSIAYAVWIYHRLWPPAQGAERYSGVVLCMRTLFLTHTGSKLAGCTLSNDLLVGKLYRVLCLIPSEGASLLGCIAVTASVSGTRMHWLAAAAALVPRSERVSVAARCGFAGKRFARRWSFRSL